MPTFTYTVNGKGWVIMAKKKDKGRKKGKQIEGVAPAARYRDALTGRFVTRKFAKKNRETTIKELRPAA